jgi:3-phosphoshikimate 1-carboxyvinyltransferase
MNADTVFLSPAPLKGTAAAIPSKSEAHRALICAALCDTETRIFLGSGADSALSEDLLATIRCLTALGADIRQMGTDLFVTPISGENTAAQFPVLDCGESGSTLRFLLPVTAVLRETARFTGSGRLPQRPVGDLVKVMEKGGVQFDKDPLPFSVSGKLAGGLYELPGDVSSQYISGLLMALPMAAADSRVRLLTPPESEPYIQMTIQSLDQFGVVVHSVPGGWDIPGGQQYRSPGKAAVGGDWSNGAFFLVSGAIDGEVTITGLDVHSPQGDRAILRILQNFGAEVCCFSDRVTVRSAPLQGCVVDLADTPDLLPILAVLAVFAKGETRLTGAGRLRLKESDRLACTADMLNGLGCQVAELPDGLVICGQAPKGGKADGCGDHRIAMSAAIAAAHGSESVRLTGALAVNKSYPGFFEEYRALGGIANVI